MSDVTFFFISAMISSFDMSTAPRLGVSRTGSISHSILSGPKHWGTRVSFFTCLVLNTWITLCLSSLRLSHKIEPKFFIECRRLPISQSTSHNYGGLIWNFVQLGLILFFRYNHDFNILLSIWSSCFKLPSCQSLIEIIALRKKC